MSTGQDFLRAFDEEMAFTRKVLERVPTDRNHWKPHPKSFSFGHLGAEPEAVDREPRPGCPSELVTPGQRQARAAIPVSQGRMLALLSRVLKASIWSAALACSRSADAPQRASSDTGRTMTAMRLEQDSSWVPSRIESRMNPDSSVVESQFDVVHFPNGRRLVVPMYGAAFVGQLPRAGKPPFVLLSGIGCYACDADQDIVIVPGDGDSIRVDVDRYSFPGLKSDGDPEPTDTLPYFRSRLFLGRCITRSRSEAVWFQASRDSTGLWHDRVYHVVIEGDSARGGVLTPSPNLDSTLARVRARQCTEVQGVHAYTL